MSNDPTQQFPPASEPTPTTMWAPPAGAPVAPAPAPKKKMSKGKKWAIAGGAVLAIGILGNLGDKTPTDAAIPVATTSEAGNFPAVDPSVQASLDKAAADRQAADAKAAADAAAAQQKADAAAAKAKADKAAAELKALTDKSTYAKLSNRAFAKIAKNPDAYVGKKYLIYGLVSQFDAATGTTTFRADVDNTRHSDWYDYEVNSIVNEGIPGQFDDVVQDDLVTLYVVVDGSFSYDTQIGGSTTVPSFTANMIKVTGSSS